jgi:hypothetical protein
MTRRTHVVLAAFAVMSLSPPPQGSARPAQTKLEARIADLKAKTAARVASERSRLDVLSPQQRVAAPPVIWRVPGALTQFKVHFDLIG